MTCGCWMLLLPRRVVNQVLRSGSPLLTHTFVRHKDLFSGLVFIAVGFTLLQAKMDFGTSATMRVVRVICVSSSSDLLLQSS